MPSRRPTGQASIGLQPRADAPLLFALHGGILNLSLGDDICVPSHSGGCLGVYPIGRMIAVTVGATNASPSQPGVEVAVGLAHLWGVDLEGPHDGVVLSLTAGHVPAHHASVALTTQDVLLRVQGHVLQSLQVRVDLRLW